jgi:hypothetical protein
MSLFKIVDDIKPRRRPRNVITIEPIARRPITKQYQPLKYDFLTDLKFSNIMKCLDELNVRFLTFTKMTQFGNFKSQTVT